MTANRVPVLMYHRIGEATTPWEAGYAVTPKRFAAHMNALSRAGYHAVDIDSLIAWMAGDKELPDKALVITFDDGYSGIEEHAVAILEKLHWPFTVFLISDLIGGKDVWTRTANPGGRIYPLLDVPQIRALKQRGGNFHSHSRSHAHLIDLGDDELATQLAGSRQALADILGEEVTYLAYPYGQYDERVVKAASQTGYRAAFSTRSGFNQRSTERFAIRRLDIHGTDTPAMLLRKVRLGSNDGRLMSMFRYYLRRLARMRSNN